MLLAVTQGLFDETPLEEIPHQEAKVRAVMREGAADVAEKIDRDEELSEEDLQRLSDRLKKAVEASQEAENKDNSDN